MAAEVSSKLTETVAELGRNYLNSSRRSQKDHLYSTLEDFTRAEFGKKRLVIIGCIGSGKSTLLNVLAGWRFVQSKETDYEFKWQTKGEGEGSRNAIFEAAMSSDSVTKKTSFANIDFRGDADRELIVVDTPGHDDPKGCEIDSKEARDALGALAADLHNKLKALDHVHAILVLHNDVISNRLNPATYQILKMVDEKFAQAEGSVWEHVVVGYSKCNGHETSWRSGLETKKAVLQKALREKVPNCKVDVPVLALGGGEIEPPPPSHDEADGLEMLWHFIAAAKPLDTSKLLPFEGQDVKWQKLIDQKDEAEAKAKAAIIYVAILVKLAALVTVLFWRHAVLPAWLSLLLFNLPGLYDELALVLGFVYWVRSELSPKSNPVRVKPPRVRCDRATPDAASTAHRTRPRDSARPRGLSRGQRRAGAVLLALCKNPVPVPIPVPVPRAPNIEPRAHRPAAPTQVGPYDVLYSAMHFYSTWLQPKLAPYLQQLGFTHATAELGKAKEE